MACQGCAQRKAALQQIVTRVLRTPATAIARIRERLAAKERR